MAEDNITIPPQLECNILKILTYIRLTQTKLINCFLMSTCTNAFITLNSLVLNNPIYNR